MQKLLNKSSTPFDQSKMTFQNNSKSILAAKMTKKTNTNTAALASAVPKATATDLTKTILEDFRTIKEDHMDLTQIAHNGKRILIIIATHSNKDIRIEAMKTNLPHFLSIPNCDIVVVNSSGLLEDSDPLRDLYRKSKVMYMEVPNEKTFDFGKWDQVLSVDQFCAYDYYVFTNDSYILTSSINHFFHLFQKAECEIYGYSDCSERRYHYQSYLFALKREAVPNLITLYDNKKDKIRNQEDVINEMEIHLSDCFKSKDCFLKIAYVTGNSGKNLFFRNDSLYNKCQEYGLLPFRKIKRILGKK
jgi:hypothetical protein